MASSQWSLNGNLSWVQEVRGRGAGEGRRARCAKTLTALLDKRSQTCTVALRIGTRRICMHVSIRPLWGCMSMQREPHQMIALACAIGSLHHRHVHNHAAGPSSKGGLHTSKYASSAPYVNAGAVAAAAKEQLRRSVPQSKHLASAHTHHTSGLPQQL